MREYRARKSPNYDAVCFHAQQCVEKYLKGFLQSHVISFAKTHSLPVLLDQCLAIRPMWEGMRNDLNDLTRYAIHFRYPGESADKENAKAAVLIMKRCTQEISETFAPNGRKIGNTGSRKDGKAVMMSHYKAVSVVREAQAKYRIARKKA